MASPFDLADNTAYRAWRDAKLAAYPKRIDELIVPLADPRALTASETHALAAACARANMAFYSAPHLPAADKSMKPARAANTFPTPTSRSTGTPTATTTRSTGAFSA
jgi:hypothetical protein